MDEIELVAPAGLHRELARIPGIRREALTGEGTALEAHKAYTEAIEKLQDLADELADRTPPRAAEATRAPAALSRAVEQAAATRGLLLAALSVPRENTGSRVDPVTGLLVPAEEEPDSPSARTRDALSAAAQQSRVRELAALADFDQAAGSTARESLKATVTGPEVKTAEEYLTRLTDQPRLSEAELGTDRAKAEAALSARIDLMRGVESSLGSAQVTRLSRLRDDDVTALSSGSPWPVPACCSPSVPARPSPVRSPARWPSCGSARPGWPPGRRPRAPRPHRAGPRTAGPRARPPWSRSASPAATTSSPRSYGPSTRCTPGSPRPAPVWRSSPVTVRT